jgi:hypothetical protein
MVRGRGRAGAGHSTGPADPSKGSPVAGRANLALPAQADPVGVVTRSARGAMQHLRKLSPSLADTPGGGEAPPLVALEAASALRRADEAIAQLHELAASRPEVAAELAELRAERTAIAPAVERAVTDRMAAWRAEARPIASQLGLGSVDLRSDDQARAVTEAKSARGVALGSTVYLHPERIAPGTADGREVLAHELVHLAQAKAPGAERDQGDRDAAELEAAELASVIAAGGTPRAPERPIDLSRPAADKDASIVKAVLGAMQHMLPKSEPAWKYLKENTDAFVAAFVGRVALIPTIPHARLRWVGDMGKAFRTALDAWLAARNRPLFDVIKELLYPVDPMRVIDQHRELDDGQPGKPSSIGKDITGPLKWQAITGTALAIEVQKAVLASLVRLMPRYLIQVDEVHPRAPEHTDIVAGHAMDEVVARMLCDQSLVGQVGKPARSAGRKKDEPHELFRDGVKLVYKWEWLGEKDSRMWNWIKIDDPADATPEDLSYHLWNTPARAAYITKTGPYFRVHPGWAHPFVDAAKHAPQDWYQPHEDNALALAESTFANEAAIAAAAKERKLKPAEAALPENLAKMKATLERSQRQLVRMRDQLAPTRLYERVLPALGWVEKHLEHLYGFPDERLAALQPVIDGQQAILFEVSGAVHELAGNKPKVEPDHPLFDVLRELANAAGESFLIDVARAQLARAKQKQATLALDSADGLLNDTRAGVQDLTGSERPPYTHGGAQAKADLADYQKQLVEMRAKQASGQSIDDGDMELLTAKLRELQFLSKTRALSVKLWVLAEEARGTIDEGIEVVANLFNSDIKDLAPKLYEITGAIRMFVHEPYDQFKAQDLKNIKAQPGTPEHKKATAWVINDKVDFARRQFEAEVSGKYNLERIFSAAAETVQGARLRTMILSIVLLIAVSVAGGVAGSIVGGAVRGAMLASTATRTVGMMRAVNMARVAGTLATISTDAAVNTVGQRIVLGNDGDSFLFNLATNAAVLAALRPLHYAAAGWKVPEVELKTLKMWEKVKVGGKIALKNTTVVTAEMITAAGVSYAIERAAKGPPKDEATAVQWVIQGASMALGRFISGRMTKIEQRLGKAAMEGTHVWLQMKRVKATAVHVEKTGDPDKALEIMLAHEKVLDDEAKALEELAKVKNGKLPPDVVATLIKGNQAERGGLRGAAFATVPLHLGGLRADDASGKVWVGTTEDIAIALHYAERAGLKVTVLEQDVAARKWTVYLDDQVIQIHELALAGRPRKAATEMSDAERAKARKYAEAAAFMQQKWEASVKRDFDGRKVIEVDHFQIGYSIGGVMNQATLPSIGPNRGSHVVVYEGHGTMETRGQQEIGQHPAKWDAPGIRTSEQSPKDAEWARSGELQHALDVGRAELQTPAYRGRVTELQRRPTDAALTEDWAAPHRKFRVKVNDGSQDRWFYTDHFDNAGGMGPGLVHDDVKAAAGVHLHDLLARRDVILGDDPAYFDKLRAGEILVWGGSPTGAWAAEPGVHAKDSHVDVVGDKRGAKDIDWNQRIEDYKRVMDEIRAAGDHPPDELVQRKQEIEKDIAAAHKGSTVRRNRKPGATYEKPDDKTGKVTIHYGTPTKVEKLPNGRIYVEFRTGSTLEAKEFDQIVLAHGQNPGAPGGPGALLGKGAAETSPGSRVYGDVPPDTIALRPVFSADRKDVVALESIDPPGIRLVGAAYAHKAIEPWIAKEHRQEFKDWLKRMEAAHVQTRNQGEISDDSTNVTPGVEHQRDKLPQANEAFAAKEFKLPGPKATLELTKDMTPDQQDAAVLQFLTIHMRADGYVGVTRLNGGKSGAIVYDVTVGGHQVGVFKVFGEMADARAEVMMLDLLAKADLKHMKAVAARGLVSVDESSGFKGAVLMEKADGDSVAKLIEKAGSGDRAAAIKQLEDAMVAVARGLGEMHTTFGKRRANGEPEYMSEKAKESDADYMLEKNFDDKGRNTAAVKRGLGADLDAVKAAVTKLRDKFVKAKVPATAYLGDANAGNFVVGKHDATKGYQDLRLIDVAPMRWGMDPKDPKVADANDPRWQPGEKGKATGAADLSRFLGSLETMGSLKPAEIDHLRDVFMRTYVEHYHPGKDPRSKVDLAAYADAERWYRIELELSILTNPAQAAGARERIIRLLAPELGTK